MLCIVVLLGLGEHPVPFALLGESVQEEIETEDGDEDPVGQRPEEEDRDGAAEHHGEGREDEHRENQDLGQDKWNHPPAVERKITHEEANESVHNEVELLVFFSRLYKNTKRNLR